MSTLIVGADGQDGRILAGFLNGKNDPPYLLNRKNLTFQGKVLSGSQSRVDLDFASFFKSQLISDIYFFAAHSRSSVERIQGQDGVDLHLEHDEVFLLLRKLLEGVVGSSLPIRFFNASSSLIFAGGDESPQREESPISPKEDYAFRKIANTALLEEYVTRAPELKALTGILYNHESIYRGPNFLSNYVINGAIDRFVGKSSEGLRINDFGAVIDLSYAEDTVTNMHALMETDASGPYIFSSGRGTSVGEFCRMVFNVLGLKSTDFCYEGEHKPLRTSCVLVGNNSKLRQRLPNIKTREPEQVVQKLVEDWLLVRKIVA